MITSLGRTFPVTTTHAPPRTGQRMEESTVSAVRTALAEHDGDVLVFLPGAREIRRVASLLDGTVGATVDLWPLFGMLDAKAQDAAIAPSPAGRRKVVIASAIAETSLTIEGVRVVVDSGWARIPRYSARSGMTRLETVRVSRASADQRRGRATDRALRRAELVACLERRQIDVEPGHLGVEPEERHRRADFDSCRVGGEFGDGGEIEMADNHHSDVGPPVEDRGEDPGVVSRVILQVGVVEDERIAPGLQALCQRGADRSTLAPVDLVQDGADDHRFITPPDGLLDEFSRPVG
jgi:hypothetical protein